MYTTITDVKAQLGADVSTDDTIITSKIVAAQAEIDRLLGRTFESATATKSYNEFYAGFDPRGRILLLDSDLLSVTTLTNGDGTVIPSSGYWLEPQNATPYSTVRLKSSYSWSFDDDGQVTVLGTWGYSAQAPADIANICTELAIYLYKIKDTPTQMGTVTPDGGSIPLPGPLYKHVQSIMRIYKSLV